LQGLVVVIIGFTLGWGAAIAPSLLAKLTSPAAQDDAVIVEGFARGSRENSSAAINANGSLADDLLGSETDLGVNMPSANIGEKGLSVKPNKPDDGQTRGNQNAVNESVATPANQPHTNTQLETTSPSEQQVNLRTEAQPELKLKPEAIPRISSDLLKRFEKAITALDKEPEQPFEATQTKSEDAPRIDQLPAWVLTQLPPMVFTTHMYASSAQDRWVKVNNRTLNEGDMIADKVRIEHIEPQHVILNYQGQTFSMSALSEW
jgi:general secretion pathway protein B